jgi:hypothetical protein
VIHSRIIVFDMPVCGIRLQGLPQFLRNIAEVAQQHAFVSLLDV